MQILSVKKPRSAKFSAGLLIIFLTGTGTVLAANVSIKTDVVTKEFGQGTYQIKACDSWIRMNLMSAGTGELGAPAGLSALSGITITNLDTHACAKTFFSIDILNSVGDKLPIYRTDGAESLCADLPCTQGSTSEQEIGLAINASGVVSLLSQDAFHTLQFDPNTAIYSVRFTQPTILANDVGRLIIQSSDTKI
jgi:hypothetical protein